MQARHDPRQLRPSAGGTGSSPEGYDLASSDVLDHTCDVLGRNIFGNGSLRSPRQLLVLDTRMSVQDRVRGRISVRDDIRSSGMQPQEDLVEVYAGPRSRWTRMDLFKASRDRKHQHWDASTALAISVVLDEHAYIMLWPSRAAASQTQH